MLFQPKMLIPAAIVLSIACGSESNDSPDDLEQTTNGNESSDGDTDETADIDDDSATSSTGSRCPTEDAPTYENFGEEFLSAHCTRCHSSTVTGIDRRGATPNYDFDTLEGVVEHIEAIEQMAAAGPKATNTFMPPSGEGPSVEQRERLGEWLACLASEAGDTN